MNDTLEIINKLMRLALNNPSHEEASAAALRAVELINKYQVPVGDIIPDRPLTYQAPPPDFAQAVADIFNDQKRTSTDGHQHNGPLSDQPGLVFSGGTETEQGNPIQRQIILAWRAIRESRKKLEAEWYRFKMTAYGRADK